MTQKPVRVLLVDDEADLCATVRRGLQLQSYEVEVVADGQEAIAKAHTWEPDVILMDLAMPKLGGLPAIKQLRAWSTVPIIVLSVMGEEDEKVRALDSGADDYLTKPFGIQELGARIRAALRRLAPSSEQTEFQFGNVTIDLARRFLAVDGAEVHLTPTEYELLRQLV
ncbi:MAG: two-component system, OmpR family, operon response regulator KdpE, partial [Chloroflexota bacterium]|nr:two-component system, OmpR family, operon response regulator KdpE [Chloroflexota bacterium]